MTPEGIWTSGYSIRRSGVVGKPTNRVGLDQASQTLPRAPVPQETQAIIAAVVTDFTPVRLCPGEEMERGVQERARGVAGTGVCAERIKRGRTGIVLRQSLLDHRPPGGCVLGEGDAPAVDRPRGWQARAGAAPRDLGPGRAVFKPGDDDGLDDLEQIVAVAEHEAGQEGGRVLTRLAKPAFDGDNVVLGESTRLAGIEAMSNQDMDGSTMGTDFGTGKVELCEMIQVFDNGTKLDYNDHAREPGPKDAAKLCLFGSGYSFFQGDTQHTHFSEKRKSRPHWTA